MKNLWTFLLFVTSTLLLTVAEPRLAASDDASPVERIDFNRDVRPILSDHCFACHGPDKASRKSELRLDIREGLFGDLGGYAAVVPTEPAESQLLERITSDDADARMPPADSGRQLSAAEIAIIRRWIEQGAHWKGHWAYEPTVRPAVPAEVGTNPQVDSQAMTDIDWFIQARLKERGLSPADEADRVTLVRRLNFDLLGLPPSPEQVRAFVDDPSENAYAELVDQILASPHFGERMAMYWLDLVRFADTNGIHGDNHRDVALYRDYVINAFNANRPFDQFTIEQLAGDLLPDATTEQKIASGYNRLLMTTREGGAQAKEYLAKYSADRVRNVSTVWMGATLGCAECHDHKFDPFSTRDFYSLAAFFADIQEVAVGMQPPFPVPTEAQAKRLQELDKRMAELRQSLEADHPELQSAQQEWEKQRTSKQQRWNALPITNLKSQGGATLQLLDDGTILASGEIPDAEVYEFAFTCDLPRITAIRLEVLPDDSLPQKGPGRAANGNFVLNEFEVLSGDKPVAWSSVTATHSQNDWDVGGSADGNPKTGWAILDQVGRENHVVFEARDDLSSGADTKFVVRMHQNYGSGHLIGRFRLEATAADRPVRATGAGGLTKELLAILETVPDQRTDEQARQLADYYRTIAPALEPLRKELAASQQEKDAINQAVPTTLISMSTTPREIRVLPRGNWLDDSGDVVAPTVPHFLRQLETGERRPTRLDLAHWLVAEDNPLVARVFVNRLWKQVFGRGLVSTLDDFGSQGARPTHPDLLDWLAREFVDSGWDSKHMLKRMVLSQAYRQSSRVTSNARQKDPFNKWLARQGRFRFDAEVIRDNALAVSGLLVDDLGGNSVKPYQPAGYWAHLNFPKRTYAHDKGRNQYRRGVYTYWARTFLHPSLLAFDAPSREECTVDRPRSNTPLQALVLLNDATYVEAARVFAEHIVQEGGSDVEDRIQFAYRRALARQARPEEIDLLGRMYADHLQQYRADLPAAEALLTVGESPVPDDIDRTELAAWTSIARVILNLHEVITRN